MRTRFSEIQDSIAVVIPCFRVKQHILHVIDSIGSEVHSIIVVDDCCPEKSGEFVKQHCSDPRVDVVFHKENQGVGGATVSGYQRAVELGATVMVKIDGDGQMDPRLLPQFVAPILYREADYMKGNRFFQFESLQGMPAIRLFGNTMLSFITKASSGYWHLMDPTNGYTAIHAGVFKLLPADKIDKRYFFESDMLFRLNTLRAVVKEVPMDSHYASEESNMKIGRIVLEFPRKHLTRFFKRLVYNYFLRRFNFCSLEIILGTLLILGGSIFGLLSWYFNSASGEYSSAGTVMVAALPIIIGTQLLLAAANYDLNDIPKESLSSRLDALRETERKLRSESSDNKQEQPLVGNL